MAQTDVLIVGAGFAGAVAARRLAEEGRKVVVIDKRPYPGGNAHDCLDDKGVRIHPHGPHIFHTNSQTVVDFLSRFTAWRPYEHRVLAQVRDQLLPIPINRTTINHLYHQTLDEAGIVAFLEGVRHHYHPARTSKEVVLNAVGEELCALFFQGYTRKQWGLELEDLGPGVAARIPVRTNDDDRYFTDQFQVMPRDGYAALFDNLLAHPNISCRFGVRFEAIKTQINAPHILYTGPIDAFFEYCFGPLPYRSLSFEHEHLPQTRFFQHVGTINYPNDHAYTRITEFKHLTGQEHSGTSIVREYPQAEGEPYYPIPRPENEALYQRYKALAAQTPHVSFIGRLAQYRYYNMDQVVAASLSWADKHINIS